MKKLFFILIAVAALFCAPAIVSAAATDTATYTTSKAEKMSAIEAHAATLAVADNNEVREASTIDKWAWLKANYGKIILLLMGVWEVVTRLWPTAADLSIVNKMLSLLKWLADWVPNFKFGGGRH